MISQTMTKQNQTKKGGNDMYKLEYKEHIILKQAAYLIMQHYNQKEYTSKKPYQQKKFIKYSETLAILYKTKTREQLLDIIERFLTSQEKKDNEKLIKHNQDQIIIPKLKEVTDKQLELMATKIQNLEQKYYLQLDTDYNNRQSILESYQQILAYKHYNIPLTPRETEETLVGNLELLDKKGAL